MPHRSPHILGSASYFTNQEALGCVETLAEGYWRNFGTAPPSSLHQNAPEAKGQTVPPWLPSLVVWWLIAVLGFVIDRWFFST